MKIKAANGVARVLKAEGIPWVSCYPDQPREQRARRGGRAHPHDGRGALRRRRRRRLLARDLRQADRRVHRHGQPERGRHPDGVRRHRARRGRTRRRSWSSPKAWARARAGTRTTTWRRRSSRSPSGWARSTAPSWCPTTCAARSRTCARAGPGPVLLIIPRDLGEYDEDEHPVHAGEGLALRSRPGRRARPRSQALLAAKDPLLYVGEGVLYADATAELLQFAELAQVPVLTTLKAQGRLPGEPPAVGRGARLARRALPEQGDVLFSIGSSLFPNRFSHAMPDAGQEDDRPVHGRHARHQPQLRDAARGDRRREADPAGARSPSCRRKPAARASARSCSTRSRTAQGGVPREVPPVDGVERDADQPVPRDRRPHEGARSRRTRSSPPTPATRAIRPARCTRRRSRAAISAGATCRRSASAWPARSAAKLAFPGAAVRPRHRRRRRLLHDGQLRGGGALQDRHHDAPHQQRRLLRLRPRLLGRRPRSVHVEGVGSRRARAWRRWRRRWASTART